MLTVRRNMRNVSVRWDYDHFEMSAPYGIGADRLHSIVDSMREDMRKLSSQGSAVSYRIGQVIHCFSCDIRIERNEKEPDILVRNIVDAGKVIVIKVGYDLDLKDEDIKRELSSMIKHAVEIMAYKKLIPYAEELLSKQSEAERKLCGGFEVGRGMRKLGHCTKSGVVQLSRNLMFLPKDAVTYIILHEFTHLTVFNHSAAFQELFTQKLKRHGIDRADTERLMKEFRWPIHR